jgi:hypothetical protein
VEERSRNNAVNAATRWALAGACGLDALANGGRLFVPLTVSMTGISSTLSKGMVLMITRDKDNWGARFTSPVAIYSLQVIRGFCGK